MFESPTLNPFLAMGRPAWTAVRSWLVELLEHEGYRDAGREPPGAAVDEVTLHLPFEVADYVDFYSSRAPRRERRADLPARTADALHAELEAPADRLPRPGRHGRRVGHRRRAAERAAQAAGRGRPVVRARRCASTSRPRSASWSACRRRRACRCRRLTSGEHVFGVVPGQRLERPRHPGLGVRAARAVPRQVVRHVGLAVGGAAGRAARRRGCPAPVQDPAVLGYLRAAGRLGAGPVAGGRRGTAPSCRGRRSPACTGRRPSSSPT